MSTVCVCRWETEADGCLTVKSTDDPLTMLSLWLSLDWVDYSRLHNSRSVYWSCSWIKVSQSLHQMELRDYNRLHMVGHSHIKCVALWHGCGSATLGQHKYTCSNYRVVQQSINQVSTVKTLVWFQIDSWLKKHNFWSLVSVFRVPNHVPLSLVHWNIWNITGRIWCAVF